MKPIWKWVIGILGTLLAVLGIGVWYLTIHWKPLLDTKIKELVSASTDSLYQVKYADLDINLALGNVTIKDLELIPDSIVYRQLVAQQKAPDNRFHIQVGAVKIRSFGLRSILFNKSLSIKNIVLDTPSVHLINEYHAYNDTLSVKSNQTLYDKIKETLRDVKVRDIALNSVNFKYSQVQEGKSDDFRLQKVNLKIQDVLIDSTSLADTTRFYHSKMIDVEIPGFEYQTPDGLYKINFDQLKINTRNKNILLTKFAYKPILGKKAFYEKVKIGTTYIEVGFDTIQYEQLDFAALWKNKKIFGKRALVKNGRVDIYADLHYPKKSENKIGKSPHQQLMKMKTALNIDSLFVENVDVSYTEMSAKYHRAGLITFNHIRGYLTNVTNDSLRLTKNKWMKADLSTKIMNKGNLDVVFTFDMTSKEGYHTYDGHLGKMQATEFNKILRPLLNVEIGSGNIRKINFAMQANDYRNWGKFNFDYDNLKINLLNDKEEGEAQTKKGILSFIVNQILINDSNPDANEVYHSANIQYQRVPQYPFFKTLWQSLLDGIKQCAGISPEREAKLMNQAQAVQKNVKGTQNAVQKTKGFIKNIFKKKDKEE